MEGCQVTAYYNEFEPFAAEWLRRLIAKNLIAPGEVDERSIVDVQPDDIKKYDQCHFFAGIGGWSLALRLAGVPDDRPVWTGSCPCQPFSAAGKQRGSEDERHLWPAFFRLIRECKPATVFGEQVAGAAGLAWLDHVCADLEESGYAAAAADLPACSVGAPHRRQRLWWVADSEVDGRREKRQDRGRIGAGNCPQGWTAGLESGGNVGSVAHAAGSGRSRSDGAELWTGYRPWTTDKSVPWADLEWLPCSDGKARPTQPGLFPLAHGVPGRVGRLRAYGNAIVPQVAAEFIGAVMECRP